MRNFILTLLLLSCIFMIGCFASSQGDLWHEWSDTEVTTYFNSQSSIVTMASDLISKKYYWFSDGTNFSYWTDTFATPNRLLGQGGGNCSDFTSLFLNYCVITGNADEVTQVLLYKNPITKFPWHYISEIRIGSQWYHQSNLSIVPVNTTEEVMLYWINKGYSNQFVIKDWKK